MDADLREDVCGSIFALGKKCGLHHSHLGTHVHLDGIPS
jgi:hypothetical protein